MQSEKDDSAGRSQQQQPLKLTDDPIPAFIRIDTGIWKCIKTVRFKGPHGLAMQVEAGATFREGIALRGVDIAAWLESLLKQ